MAKINPQARLGVGNAGALARNRRHHALMYRQIPAPDPFQRPIQAIALRNIAMWTYAVNDIGRLIAKDLAGDDLTMKARGIGVPDLTRSCQGPTRRQATQPSVIWRKFS